MFIGDSPFFLRRVTPTASVEHAPVFDSQRNTLIREVAVIIPESGPSFFVVAGRRRGLQTMRQDRGQPDEAARLSQSTAPALWG
jgi:hypothetical protein